MVGDQNAKRLRKLQQITRAKHQSVAPTPVDKIETVAGTCAHIVSSQK